MIGAARPSIADPFLPKKIEEGRIEDIRECIGCNICVSGDHHSVPIRCTQNPTMGEEWRRGWHPERIGPKTSGGNVLIVGAGPAGLEAARALGQRGYRVTLADKANEAGGRLVNERRLPGLTEWGRVVDYRTYQISQMANVDLYLESLMTPETLNDFGADHIALATGAKWKKDGIGRHNPLGIDITVGAKVFSPDDIMAGIELKGPVVVFDDDHFYMGGAISEKLRRDGCEVTLVTPAAEGSSWTHNTLDQHAVQKQLMELGVRIVTTHNLTVIRSNAVDLSCVYTGTSKTLDCSATVLVTMRQPVDDLWQAYPDLIRIGDVLSPSTIAAAVYSGHLFARELGESNVGNVPFRRELINLSLS